MTITQQNMISIVSGCKCCKNCLIIAFPSSLLSRTKMDFQMDARMCVLMVLGIKAKSTSFYVIMKKFHIIFLIFAWPCEMHLRMKFSIAYLTIWHGYESFSIYVQSILETWNLLQSWHNNFTCSCEFSRDYANWTIEQGNNPCNYFFLQHFLTKL